VNLTTYGDGLYTFRGRVMDAAGNEATTAAITMYYDRSVADASMVVVGFSDYGYSGATADGISNDNSFTLTVAGATEGGVFAEYQYRTAASSAWQTFGSAGLGVSAAAVDTVLSSLGDNSYTFRALLTDAAGNTSDSFFSMEYDSTPPAPGGISFGADWSDYGHPDGGATSDRRTNDGVFTLSLGGQQTIGAQSYYEMLTPSGGTVWTDLGSSSVNLTTYGDGLYTFRGRVMDAAGNEATTAAITMYYDRSVSVGQVSISSIDGLLAVQLVDASFTLDVVGEEAGSALSFEVDPPGNLSITSFEPIGSGFTFNGGSFTVGQDYSVTLGATGIWVFRAVVTDVAGNSGYAGHISLGVFDSTDEVASYSGDFSPIYMKPEGGGGIGGGTSSSPSNDSQFALQSIDFELDLSQTSPSDAKASELGNVLSSYLDSGLNVQTSVEPLGLAPSGRLLESVPALANALSDYQIANIGLVKSDQAADLLRKVKEPSEAYPKPILAPPNGSS
jgi:hypothetical protein